MWAAGSLYSLVAIDLATGRPFTLDAAQCAFGFRDSVFKHAAPLAEQEGAGPPWGLGLAGRGHHARARLAAQGLARPELGYLDLEEAYRAGRGAADGAADLDWVCEMPSCQSCPTRPSSATPAASSRTHGDAERCQDIIARDPKIVHSPMADGSIKLAAGWLIETCGWKGKSVGKAGGVRQTGPGAGEPRHRRMTT